MLDPSYLADLNAAAEEARADLAARRERRLNGDEPQMWEVPQKQVVEPAPRPKPQTGKAMDAASSKAWNAWANNLVQRRLEETVGILGEEVARMLKRERENMRQEWAEAVAEYILPLAARVEKLEAAQSAKGE